MTLTELRYIVAVAREQHFGRAADSCFVSQPTLSVAIKRLEDELGVALFERRPAGVVTTTIGEAIVRQAQRVLEESERIRELARHNLDPFAQPLRLGVIHTIGPYLLPELVPILKKRVPGMSLTIEENVTARLTELLHHGELDVIIISRPYDESGVDTLDLYDEPFFVALPHGHPLSQNDSIDAEALARETMLMLGNGHCFRDQVLSSCPGISRTGGPQKTYLEGSSLETIRYMVATGVGLSILPASSLRTTDSTLIDIRPFQGMPPTRRVSLAWRRSFPRLEAINLLARIIRGLPIEGITVIDPEPVAAAG